MLAKEMSSICEVWGLPLVLYWVVALFRSSLQEQGLLILDSERADEAVVS